MDSYRIVYPGGDKSKITVAAIWDYEVDEYALASRRRFCEEDEEEAYRYAKELAQQNGLQYIPSTDEGYDNNTYLD